MIFVIGSGPAGVSCTAALLKRGYSVTMLDVGVKLEQDKVEMLANIKMQWDERIVVQLKQQLNSNNPVKLSHNSFYPYAEVAQHLNFQQGNGVHCMPSFSQGGLSNVWGAFVETYSNEQMADWPITASQLAAYYKTVLGFLYHPNAYPQFSGAGIDEGLKNYDHSSQQAQKLLKHLAIYRNKLQDNGYRFGAANLAVNFREAETQHCRYCGLCQHGCPLDLIYSANHTLRDLLKNNKFKYIKNTVVDLIEESIDKVFISAHDSMTRENMRFEGARVFAACGPLISTLLALKSLRKQHHKIEFLDSSHFLLPCLMYDRVKNVEKEKLHTLCQLYLKLTNADISTQAINLQIYTYMDHYAEKFKHIFKTSYALISPLLRPLVDRMLVIQGHLHSQNSHKFTMQIKNDGKLISLSPLWNANVHNTLKLLAKHLRKNKQYLGFTPINFMLKQSKIGKSFHYGGSMPMCLEPKEFETDIWGRPFGFKRWHIVDATIFPSIPAGSITPTIMANAYRIGMEYPNIY